MNQELPKSWASSTLGELAVYIQRGKSPKYADKSKLPVVNQKCIRWFGIQEEHLKFIHPDQVSAWPQERYISAGDILWNSTGTGTIGRATIVTKKDCETPKVIDSHVTLVRFDNWTNARFVFRWIQSSHVQDEISGLHTGSTNQVELSREKIRSLAIPLPPLAEQHRIVAKLDSILPRVEMVRVRLEKIPALVKRFRQSVLTAAVTGKLTEGWREKNPDSASLPVTLNTDLEKKKKWRLENRFNRGLETVDSELEYHFDIPTNWEWSNWGTLSEWLTYGFTRPMPHVHTGVPIVTGKNVFGGKVQLDSSDFTTKEAFSELSEKDLPRVGDILVTKDGSIGRSALVDSEAGPFCINQSVAVIWLRTTTQNKNFLHLIIQSEYSQNFISDFKQGVAIPHLSITDLARCPIPIPPKSEQEEIVRQVDKLFALADKLEAHYHRAMARVEKFPQAILAKAFRGELVPQDPNDEPAEKLLARIRQERAGMESVGRAKKKPSLQPKRAKAKATA